MLNGTSSVIGNSVSKAGDAIGDATSTVRDVASEKGSVLEGIARAAIRALPGVPERLFLSLLDRVGLSRKPARTDGLGAFALGFAAGGATAALLTPMSGPQMRKQIVGALKRLGAASEETASGTQTRVSEPESRETGDAASTSGAAVITINVPNDPTLYKAQFYNQFIVADPKANSLGFAFSNGGAATLGKQ